MGFSVRGIYGVGELKKFLDEHFHCFLPVAEAAVHHQTFSKISQLAYVSWPCIVGQLFHMCRGEGDRGQFMSLGKKPDEKLEE